MPLPQGRQQRRGFIELPRREVDADPVDDVPAIEQAPGFDLADRFANDPAADLHDQTGFLEERDESRGGDQPLARMVPAQQRFRTDHPVVAEPQDRLVVQRQFGVVESLPQLLGKRIAPGRRPGQRRLPGAHLARSQRFCLPQGKAEIAQRVLGFAMRRGGGDEADAGLVRLAPIGGGAGVNL